MVPAAAPAAYLRPLTSVCHPYRLSIAECDRQGTLPRMTHAHHLLCTFPSLSGLLKHVDAFDWPKTAVIQNESLGYLCYMPETEGHDFPVTNVLCPYCSY